MTEKTYFWTHGGGGDATYSPYDASEFNLYQFLPLVGSGSNEAYIVPGYLEDLEVAFAGTGLNAVVVHPGAAILDNYLYVSDEDIVIPLEYPATNFYRRDIIVLRYSQPNGKPKVRLDVVKGVESTTYPLTPALTQTTAVFEVPLATVMVAYYGQTNNLQDKRKFIYTLYTKQKYAGKIGNLLENSEFLGFSYEGTASKIPDHWIFMASSGAPVLSRSTLTVGSGRDNFGCALASTDSISIGQYVRAKNSVYTFSGYYTSLASASGYISLYLIPYDSSGVAIPNQSRNYFINRLDTTEFSGYFQFTMSAPEETAYILVEAILSNASVSQLICVEGYHPADFRPINEIIMFTRAIPDASWTNTAKSTGTTTINLGVSFSNLVKNYTKAVILRLRGNDSGSAAAANCYLRALGYAAPFNSIYGELDIGGVVNDVKRDTTAIVPVDQIYYATGAAGAQFRLEVLATGAATFDATVEIVGIII